MTCNTRPHCTLRGAPMYGQVWQIALHPEITATSILFASSWLVSFIIKQRHGRDYERYLLAIAGTFKQTFSYLTRTKLPYPVIQIIKIISEAVFTHLGNFELYAFASSYTYSWHYLVHTGLKIQLINKTTSSTTKTGGLHALTSVYYRLRFTLTDG